MSAELAKSLDEHEQRAVMRLFTGKIAHTRLDAHQIARFADISPERVHGVLEPLIASGQLASGLRERRVFFGLPAAFPKPKPSKAANPESGVRPAIELRYDMRRRLLREALDFGRTLTAADAAEILGVRRHEIGADILNGFVCEGFAQVSTEPVGCTTRRVWRRRGGT